MSRTIEIAATPTVVLAAVKASVPGRPEPMIAVGFGSTLDDGEFFAVTVADAVKLHWLIGMALGDPVPVASSQV